MTNQHTRKRKALQLYPKDIFTKLEFDELLNILQSKCLSPLGKEKVAAIPMSTDVKTIRRELLRVREFKAMLTGELSDFPESNYLDLREELKLMEVQGYALDAEQIFRIYKVLKTVHKMFLFFHKEDGARMEQFPQLFELLKGLSFESVLINEIKTIMDDDGKIRPDASPELMRIRKFMQQRYRDLDARFRSTLNEYRKLGYLSDEGESVRHGRRVLAVKSEHKRKIKGIIHDESSTGRTAFLEPEDVLAINNDIFESQQQEKREIYRILKELSARIRPFLPKLRNYQLLLGRFDYIRAKALLAIDLNAVMPEVSSERKIVLQEARHPLLWLLNKKAKKTTVPLSVDINIVNRILVISGPNAGGKSVAMKTIGLLQLMLQAGMLVPCQQSSQVGIFQKVFVDMGDEQSLENDLSTYSSRLKNMKHFTENANAGTLILIDEFGSGTDPAFGGAMAEAVLDNLNRRFCYGVITTHYSNLKIYATNAKGIFNGAMSFDHSNLSPQYRLEVGKPGSSYAFELATKSQLDSKVIEDAKLKVGDDYREFDELLSTLQTEKQQILQREAEIASKERKLDKLLEEYNAKTKKFERKRKTMLLEAEQQALQAVTQVNKRFETLVREWNEQKGSKQQIKRVKEAVQQDKKRLQDSIEKHKEELFYRESSKELQVGSYVTLRNGREPGKVLELRKNKAIVEFGQMKTNVPTKELTVVEVVKKQQRAKPASSTYSHIAQIGSFTNSIDVRGKRREEAMKELEGFIDKALIVNANQVKVIHGIGDGILGRALRDILKGIPQVHSVRFEEPEYGGNGISIVDFK